MKSIMELLEQEKSIVRQINDWDETFEREFEWAISDKKRANETACFEYIAEYDDFCKEEGYKVPIINCGAKFYSRMYLDYQYEREQKADRILSSTGKEDALNDLYSELRAIRAEIKEALNF